MKKATIDDYEIGNLVFGNSRGNYPIDRENFDDRFYKVLTKAGYDSYGCDESENVSPHFVVRPYYWGDDEEEAEKPNFECKELGLEIKWYKYPLRDAYSNIPFTEEIMKKLEDFVNG